MPDPSTFSLASWYDRGMSRPSFIIATEDVPEKPTATRRATSSLGTGAPSVARPVFERSASTSCGSSPESGTSWPHAEEKEEEFVYVLEGTVDAWIDGELHPMKPGDLAAFPAGTGICHTFLNNGERDALLLVGGEASKPDNRIFYPLHPHRRAEVAPRPVVGRHPASRARSTRRKAGRAQVEGDCDEVTAGAQATRIVSDRR